MIFVFCVEKKKPHAQSALRILFFGKIIHAKNASGVCMPLVDLKHESACVSELPDIISLISKVQLNMVYTCVHHPKDSKRAFF